MSSVKSFDPYQDQVTALFAFNNNATNSSYYEAVPHDQGTGWNVYGTQTYQSKPNGGANTYSTTAKFGTHSFNFGGARRIHYSNYDAFPMWKDFTIEAWIYMTDVSTDNYVFGRGDLGTSLLGTYLKVNSSGNGLAFWWMNNVLISTSTAGLFTTNTWYHVAVTRSNGSWKVFVNGVQEGSTGSSSTINRTSTQLVLGGDNVTSATNYFKGLVDDFRFTTMCRYSQNFAPPVAAHPAYAAFQVSTAPDPYFANTVALLHLNGTNNTRVITDSSVANIACTANGTAAAFGVLTTTSTHVRFGTAGFLTCDGFLATTAGHIQLPAANSNLNMSTGDFTIEFWTERTGSPIIGYLFAGTTNNTGLDLKMIDAASGQIRVLWNNTTLITSADIIYDGYFKHVAITRSGSTIYLFINGILQGTGTNSSSIDLSSGIFGRQTTTDVTTQYRGCFDDIRITKGVARYTGNFIIPRGEFPNS